MSAQIGISSPAVNSAKSAHVQGFWTPAITRHSARSASRVQKARRHEVAGNRHRLSRRLISWALPNLKGVGRVYQQTFIDTYTKVACAKLYDRKTPITAADLLNDRVLPLFEEHDVKLLRVLTDRGSEYCGNPERHEYELYLAVEDIDHSRTKTKSPQTNGICERFHKTVLNEFYRVAFRKKVYRSIDELQTDLDLWLREYNEQRPHQGRWCFGKTPMQTFLDAMPIAKEKMIAA
jgi:transposase InsO family protein